MRPSHEDWTFRYTTENTKPYDWVLINLRPHTLTAPTEAYLGFEGGSAGRMVCVRSTKIITTPLINMLTEHSKVTRSLLTFVVQGG